MNANIINMNQSISPTTLPELILKDWTMDFIGGLPKVGGYHSIMVVVDCLSKFGHFIILKHPFTEKQVADVFIERVVSKHEIPKSIITDRERSF